MTTLTVEGGQRLHGAAIAPPDKSVFHRAALLSLLGEGTARIHPLSLGADNQATLAAVRQLGATVEIDEDDNAALVTGVGGLEGLRIPSTPIDCGNSGTTMRLLSGILAGVAGPVTLTGDDSLCRRPMSRLLPLEKMGARIEGVVRDGRMYPPITIHGGRLGGAKIDLAIASAQVKSALLLAGLFASGNTRIAEPARSRDHTERMLRALGAHIEERGLELELEPLERPWKNSEIEVVPDMSSAAFLLGAALVTGSPDVRVRTGVNPTRTGFLDALAAAGVDIERAEEGESGTEPVAEVSVRPRAFSGTTIAGELCLRAIDEIPLLAALACFAQGTTHIRDARELRVKESDRLSETAALLRAFGAQVEEHEDGLSVEGAPEALRPAEVEGGADHRIAMTAVVMGLGVEGCTRVRGADIIDVSFPGFARELRKLGARVSE